MAEVVATPEPHASPPVIAVKALRKNYRMGTETIHALNGVDFALFEVRLTTLVTDPSRNRVENQVIAVAVDVKGCLRPLHLPLTVNAVHFGSS